MQDVLPWIGALAILLGWAHSSGKLSRSLDHVAEGLKELSVIVQNERATNAAQDARLDGHEKRLDGHDTRLHDLERGA